MLNIVKRNVKKKLEIIFHEEMTYDRYFWSINIVKKGLEVTIT